MQILGQLQVLNNIYYMLIMFLNSSKQLSLLITITIDIISAMVTCVHLLMLRCVII
jgi:hypothetical protein